MGQDRTFRGDLILNHVVYTVKSQTGWPDGASVPFTNLKFVSSSGRWSDRYRLLNVAMMVSGHSGGLAHLEWIQKDRLYVRFSKEELIDS